MRIKQSFDGNANLMSLSRELDMTTNYAYNPTYIPVEPNMCYSSVNPDNLNATGGSTSQSAATSEYDDVI